LREQPTHKEFLIKSCQKPNLNIPDARCNVQVTGNTGNKLTHTRKQVVKIQNARNTSDK
jgi:hypothetical protein